MKSESRQTKNTTVFPRWEAKHLIGEVFWIRCAFSPTSKKHTKRKIHMCHGWRGSLSTAKHENHWKSTFIEGSSLYREKNAGKFCIYYITISHKLGLIPLHWDYFGEKNTTAYFGQSTTYEPDRSIYIYIYIYQPWILWVQISIIDFPGDFSGFDTPRSSTHPYRRNMSSLPGMKVKQVAATVSNMQWCKLQV